MYSVQNSQPTAEQHFERAGDCLTWKGKIIQWLWAIGHSIPLLNRVVAAADRYFNENRALTQMQAQLGDISIPKLDERIDEASLSESLQNDPFRDFFRKNLLEISQKMDPNAVMRAIDGEGNDVLLLKFSNKTPLEEIDEFDVRFRVAFSSGRVFHLEYFYSPPTKKTRSYTCGHTGGLQFQGQDGAFTILKRLSPSSLESLTATPEMQALKAHQQHMARNEHQPTVYC